MGLVRRIVKLGMASVLPPRVFLVRGPARPASGAPHIALTFDDGPDPALTPRVLDKLGDLGIRATFFVIGREARRHVHLLRRLAAEGHDIGNHTETHGEPRETSAATFLEEVRRTRALVEDVTGRPCLLVRPPRGALTVPKLRGLWELGHTVVLWNVEPGGRATSSGEPLRRWFARFRPRAGDIVLLHDDQENALEAVDCISVVARLGEVRFATISEWVAPEVRPEPPLRPEAA